LSARSVRRAAAQLEELGLTGNLLEDADTTVGELVREMDRCLAYIPKLLAKTADTVDVNPLNIDK
jgi:hypothetical protein